MASIWDWTYQNKVTTGENKSGWKMYEGKVYTYAMYINSLYDLFRDNWVLYMDVLGKPLTYKQKQGYLNRLAEFKNNLYAYFICSVGTLEKTDGGVVVKQNRKNYDNYVAEQFIKALTAKRYLYDDDKQFPLISNQQYEEMCTIIRNPLSTGFLYDYVKATDWDNIFTTSGEAFNDGSPSGSSLDLSTLYVLLGAVLLVILIKN